MATKLKVTLVKSLIGQVKKNKLQIAALGLRKMQQSVLLPDTPDIRGKIHRAKHMLSVETVEVADEKKPVAKKAAKPEVTTTEEKPKTRSKKKTEPETNEE